MDINIRTEVLHPVFSVLLLKYRDTKISMHHLVLRPTNKTEQKHTTSGSFPCPLSILKPSLLKCLVNRVSLLFWNTKFKTLFKFFNSFPLTTHRKVILWQFLNCYPSASKWKQTSRTNSKDYYSSVYHKGSLPRLLCTFILFSKKTDSSESKLICILNRTLTEMEQVVLRLFNGTQLRLEFLCLKSWRIL